MWEYKSREFTQDINGARFKLDCRIGGNYDSVIKGELTGVSILFNKLSV